MLLNHEIYSIFEQFDCYESRAQSDRVLSEKRNLPVRIILNSSIDDLKEVKMKNVAKM